MMQIQWVPVRSNYGFGELIRADRLMAEGIGFGFGCFEGEVA